MNKLTQTILFTALACTSAAVHAVPNIWDSSMQQGFVEYVLSNSKNQTIIVACNVGAGDQIDHGFHYYPKGLSGNSVDLKDVSVRFNGKTAAYPPSKNGLPTSTRGGANQWVNFARGIAKARTIDLYSRNKLIATFKPSAHSIKTVAKELADCQPVGW